MAQQDTRLTTEDREILNAFSRMLEGLSEYLGDGYELILYGLDAQGGYAPVRVISSSTLHVLQEGLPFTAEPAAALLRRLQPEGEAMSDHVSFYCSDLHGEPMHCTVIAVRGAAQEVIGLLCIHFYLNTPLRCVLNTLVEGHADAQPASLGMQNTGDIVADAVQRTVAAIEAEKVPPSARNREIVTRLYNAGIFNIKEAVCRVAEMLQLSKNTVYLHLRSCKDKEDAVFAN